MAADVKISTWARNAPNTTPAMAKSVANYANAQLIKMEAIADGYAEGIALDIYGNLSVTFRHDPGIVARMCGVALSIPSRR